ncbi:MAG TPA: N-acetyltransferase [Bacteroides sp.]|jgi:GNAT superfamily N-acetyltransferase|uniref:GNAT family N-acetyltransferase n=1 Tax=Lachnospira sp. TaxID=2049031 RepID=UPI000ED81E8E|nr:N-acetyltransferase [Bacteroides sp.]
MNFELACLEDFNEIENLYWDLIDKSKEEPSFPDWKKGVHPSADFLMAGIVQKELFVLRDVRYEYRGMGLATQFVKNLISYAKLENIEAIHLDVIDKNTLADKLYIRAGFKYVSTENIFYEVVGNRQFRMYEYVIE